MQHTFLGFDPGGLMAFGWCSLVMGDEGRCLDIQTGTCSIAGKAFEAATGSFQGKPAAVGVNAPMYWSQELDRRADQIVRGMVLSQGGKSSTVTAINALTGACLAQGVIVAALCRERWAQVVITEAHPRALVQLCADAENFLSELDLSNEHERDAALSAYTAWAYKQPTAGWQDLRTMEASVFEPISGPPPVYWFPAA